MAINADRFRFDGKYSDTDFGLIICGIGSDLDDTTSGGSKLEKNTYYSPIRKTWNYIGFKYSEPLEFTFDVIKKDCYNTGTKLTRQDIEDIERWLIRDGDKELVIYKEGYEDVYFYGTFTNVDIKSIGGTDVGLSLTIQTNAPFGFSGMKTVSIGSGTTVIDNSSEIGEICVDVDITCNSATNIIIQNTATNDKVVFNNCVSGEKITIDGKTKIIKSSIDTHNIYDDFNFGYLHIRNTYDRRDNYISVEGSATVTIKYQEIRKVGV